MRFKAGDHAMAKWPGSALYFHAKVIKVDQDEGVAEVLYEDGTEMEVPIQYLKSELTFKRKSKSPARQRRRSRSRSPGRSPARQSRQSKAATQKEETQKYRSTASSASSSEDSKKAIVTSDRQKAAVLRSSKYEKGETKEMKSFGVEKTVTKTYQSKVMVEKISENNSPTKTMTVKSVSSSLTAKKKHQYEFGGPFGVLFQYLILPVWPVLVLTCCSSSKCELQKFDISEIPQKLSAYYDQTGSLIVVGFLLFHAFCYALPFGSIVDGPDTITGRRIEYRVSALYTLFFTGVAYGALVYFGYPVVMVLDKIFPIMITCIVLSYIFNILLHLKSYGADEDELNPRANTGCTIYDVFMGRELHPKFGKYFQLKLYIYRVSMTAFMLIPLLYLQQEYTTTKTVRPNIGFLVATQIVYSFLVFFSDEEQTFYTFDIKHEGLSLQNVYGNLVTVPFMYTINTRYLFEHPDTPDTPTPILATFVLLAVSGLVLIVGSGAQKRKFRQNPYDPSLSALESIPPSKRNGQRLLVSSYWGIVRHPNYLGEILIGIAYGLICGFNDILPWIYVIFVTGLLVHRSFRDDQRCQEKHGYAWAEYCKRVRYHVIPFIF